jgi:hypothetical protein
MPHRRRVDRVEASCRLRRGASSLAILRYLARQSVTLFDTRQLARFPNQPFKREADCGVRNFAALLAIGRAIAEVVSKIRNPNETK